MKAIRDLSQLEWTLTGWMPHLWDFGGFISRGSLTDADIYPIPAKVPGSVQSALRDAGILPDWNVGTNFRQCEWAENRHWIYQASIPDGWLRGGTVARLCCDGLDYSGWVFLNKQRIGEFKGTHVPHTFDLRPFIGTAGNVLSIIFDCPPRWLGQSGYTSRIRDWKPRFNYTWDWTARLVQTGIWDSIRLEVSDGLELADVRCTTDVDAAWLTGLLRVKARVPAVPGLQARIALANGRTGIRSHTCDAATLARGITWRRLPIELWWPNLQGPQPLYTLRCELLDDRGAVLDRIERRVGFKIVTWARCQDAPGGADPWICVVNGRPVFLQGVNWTPIRPNFSDVPEADYRKRLQAYRDLGCNILRVWGGGFIEKDCFYDICDELGLLVWQEFPLSSAGCDNWPPEDRPRIKELAGIAESAIARRQHHVSLAIWCGGNELQGGLDGSKAGLGKPIDLGHPLMAAWRRIVARHDPTRRFLPTSASGPRFVSSISDYGKGLHWDVHGPWQAPGDMAELEKYWQGDDALFRSEVGCPGASPAEIIRASKGELDELPGIASNPLWRRGAGGIWAEQHVFTGQHGREPRDLDEYVVWSQQRQKQALATAIRHCKRRFPRIGGIIIWMGHDSFPCAANLSVLDFHGNLKPAAEALREWFTRTVESVQGTHHV